MIEYGRRENLWRDYYSALHSGNKQLAERILKLLHSPPASPGRSTSNPTSGVSCRKCRGRI